MKVVSGTHFCRVLRQNGWVHLRTKGSHQTWGKTGYSDVTVPVHAGRDLGRGLLAALLKQSGLTEADLLEPISKCKGKNLLILAR